MLDDTRLSREGMPGLSWAEVKKIQTTSFSEVNKEPIYNTSQLEEGSKQSLAVLVHLRIEKGPEIYLLPHNDFI